MADPLSIIASVVSVGTAALQSSKLLYELVDGIVNAPEEIIAISKDTHAFYDIVASLASALTDDEVTKYVSEDVVIVAMLANLKNPLRNCAMTLGQLMVKIQSRVRPAENGMSFRFSVNVQWYFKKKSVKESLDRLGHNKATLDTALNTIGTLRIIAATGHNQHTALELANQRDSMETDPGFMLRRYVKEMSTSGSIAPQSPLLDSAINSPILEEDLIPQLEIQNPEKRSGLSGASSLGDRRLNTLISAESPIRRAPATSKVASDRARLQKAVTERDELHQAARKGDDLAVQLLLIDGADVNAKAVDNRTALHFAAEHGNEAVARTLLEHGSDPNAKSISHGSEFSRKHYGGRTPLHWAAEQGYDCIVQLLLSHNADPSATNATLRTPLQEATMYGHIAAAKVLIENCAPVNAQDDVGFAPLHEAAKPWGGGSDAGRLEIGKQLLDHGADIEVTTNASCRLPLRTPLHLAVEQNFMPMIRLLIEKSANLTAQNSDGWMAIHTAAFSDFLPIVRLLLDAGVDVDVKDRDENETALHKAAALGHTSIICLLLKRGADVCLVNNLGRDVLQHAQRHRQTGNEEAVDFLQKYYAWHTLERGR